VTLIGIVLTCRSTEISLIEPPLVLFQTPITCPRKIASPTRRLKGRIVQLCSCYLLPSSVERRVGTNSRMLGSRKD